MIFKKLAKNRWKLELQQILQSVILIFRGFYAAKVLIFIRISIQKSATKRLTPLRPQIDQIRRNDPYQFNNYSIEINLPVTLILTFFASLATSNLYYLNLSDIRPPLTVAWSALTAFSQLSSAIKRSSFIQFIPFLMVIWLTFLDKKPTLYFVLSTIIKHHIYSIGMQKYL